MLGPDRPGLVLSDYRIPVGVIQMGTTRGWTLVANEPDFLAIASNPDRKGLTQRELLVYSKFDDEWFSLMIPGSATCPRLINGWLAGAVANDPSGTDYERHSSGPPVIGNKVVMVRPLERRVFTLELGPEPEMLWIQSDRVYYRVGRELYKARIENASLADQSMIARASWVFGAHWAFSGSE